LPLLRAKRVAVVGVGTVGSQIANELAKCGVGHLRLIDHDRLEVANLSRHILPVAYVGRNKAEGLAEHLAAQVDGLRAEAIPSKIDQSVPDDLLDEWLDVDLIVAATDDRQAQRRIGQRAFVPATPAIFPALYVEGGGEVIVQLDHGWPCFGCWDYFRTEEEQLRGVTGLNISGWPVIYTSIRLCLGMLDPSSEHREMMVERGERQPTQGFLLRPSGDLHTVSLIWRPNCPSCGVGSAESLRRPADLIRRPATVRARRPPVRQPVERPTGLTIESLVSNFIPGIFVWVLWCLAVWFVVTLLFVIAGSSAEHTEGGKIILYSLYFGPVLIAVLGVVVASLPERDRES
jgi:ThiF family